MDVVVHQVVVQGDGGGGSFARGGDDLGARVGHVAGDRDAGTVVRPTGSSSTQPSSSRAQPRLRPGRCSGTNRGPHEHRSAGDDPAVARARRRVSRSSSTTRREHDALDDADGRAASWSRWSRVSCRCARRTRRRRSTAAPAGRAGPPRASRRARRAAGRGPRSRGSTGSAGRRGPTAPAVRGCRGARRAGRWRAAAGGRSAAGRRASRTWKPERRSGRCRHRPSTRRPPYPGTSSRPAARSSARRHAVAGQEALHVRGGRVARLTGVHDGDRAAGPGQDQRGRQAGGAAADHHHVVVVHDPRCAPRRRSTTNVAVPGKRGVE